MTYADIRVYVRPVLGQIGQRMIKMDIYDISISLPKTDILSKVVERGQKVRITRMATYSYEVDISDFCDVLGESVISVETLKREEEDEDGLKYNPGILRISDIDDDVVISVEII